jgi:predicted solute-binding protein
MGILDNLEAYLEHQDKCVYCGEKALYTQIGQVGRIYRVVDVCKKHFVQDEPS